MDNQKEKCVAGCMHYHGGEIKHHIDCPFYPESMTKLFDDTTKDRDHWKQKAMEKV